jgi:hypothetical protein
MAMRHAMGKGGPSIVEVTQRIHAEMKHANDGYGILCNGVYQPMLLCLDGPEFDPPPAKCGSKKGKFEKPQGRTM